jgi:hypothetical protein
MGALSTGVMSLLDLAKRQDPNGKIAKIVELLSQNNGILADMRWQEGNLQTGHRTTVRTGLPTVAWRLLNGGVTPSHSTTAQIDEQTAMLEGWHEVDKDLAELSGNVSEYRASEATAFMEAFNQEMASTLFYGNSGVSPEEFTGLAPRYSSLSATNGVNVLNGGGVSTDNTSIWLVVWGPQTVFGIIPKGSRAGLQHSDLGLQTIQVATGIGTDRMRAYQDHWQWKCGIALRDWRFVVRIANLDVSNLVAKTSAADLTELMIKAIHRLPEGGLNMGRPAFYMNRSVFQMLDIQRRDDVIAGGGLSYDNVDGKRTPTFRGIPIRTCDALLESEDLVA